MDVSANNREVMNRLLTPKQVAMILNCSDDLVVSLIDAGKLRAANIAPGKKRRELRIRPEWIDEFLDSSSKSPIGESKSIKESFTKLRSSTIQAAPLKHLKPMPHIKRAPPKG